MSGHLRLVGNNDAKVEYYRSLVGDLITMIPQSEIESIPVVDRLQLAEWLVDSWSACNPALETRRIDALARIEGLHDDVHALHGEGA